MSKSPRAIRSVVVRIAFAAFAFASFVGLAAIAGTHVQTQDLSGDKANGVVVTEYNAANEFSLTQGGTTGVWGYGHSVSGTDDTFVPATQGVNAFPCGFAFGNWTDPAAEADNPAVGRNQGSTFFCSGYGAWSPEILSFHPGYHFAASRRAVLRWTAPTAGTFLVNGSFLRHSPIATTDVRILKNVATTLFSGNVYSGAYDQAFSLTVTVAAADTLDFSIGSGGDGYYGDGTALALTIGEPVTACQTAPGDLRVSVPADNSPSDVKSGNTNANLVGDAIYTNSGKVGRAFSFDGAGDYVRIEDNAAQKPVDQFTLEGWFKFNASGGIIQLVGKPLRNTFVNSYGLYTENGTLSGIVGNTAQYTLVKSNFNPQIGVWHHLAFTYQFAAGVSTLKLYANGVEVTSAVDGTLNLPLFYDANPYPFLIGADFENDGLAFPFNGQADEVSLYSRALTQPELFDLTKHSSFGKCQPGGCVQAPSGMDSWFQGEANAIDSRSNDHGTNNGATFASGKVGQAYSLDGTGQHVTFGNSAGNFGTSDFTVEFWIETSNNRLEEILSKRLCGFNGIHYFDVRKFGDGRILAELGNGPSAIALFSTQTVTDGNLHHIAIRRSGDTFSMYIDGALETSDIGVNAMGINLNNGAPFVIGALACIGIDTTQPFTGLIDEVSLYSKALSPIEISSIHTAGQSGKCKPSPLSTTANQIAWFTGDGYTDDISGNGNNGAFVGGSSYAVGKVGQDLDFTGVQTVQAPDSATLDLTNAFTIETWVSPTAAGLGTQQTFFVSKGNLNFGTTQSYGILFYQDRRIGNRVGNGSTFDTLNSTAQIPLNTFTHIATTYDGSTLRVYINGVLDGSGATAIGALLNSSQPLIVGGGDFGGSTINAQSAIDEVSLYNRALTSSELAAIYNAGVAGKSKSAATSVNFARNARGTAAPGFAPTSVHLDDVDVVFQQVTTAGITSKSGIDLSLSPALPQSTIFSGLAYDISTTAEFTTATVCFNLPSFNDSVQFAKLRILHLESGNWMNRTDLPSSDFGTRTLCSTSLSSLSPFVIVEALAPSAASVSVSGRVTTAGGGGITNATLILSGGGLITPRTVNTSSFGYYQFNGLEAGATYVVTIGAKRFRFAVPSRILTLSDSITDFDFTANPQE